MRTATISACKMTARAASAIFYLVLSLYWLLESVAYTRSFLLDQPPYGWLRWFEDAQGAVSVCIALIGSAAFWSARRRGVSVTASLLSGAVAACELLRRHMHGEHVAFAFSFVVLIPFFAFALATYGERGDTGVTDEGAGTALIPYSAVVAATAGMVLCCAAAIAWRDWQQQARALQWRDMQLLLIAEVASVAAMLCAASLINLLGLAMGNTRTVNMRPFLAPGAITIVIAACCGLFLQHTLSVNAVPAWAYSLVFASALVFAACMLRPPIRLTRSTAAAGIAGAAIVAVAVPVIIADQDWNGLFSGSVALLFWIATCSFAPRLARSPKRYSARALLGVALACAIAYMGVTKSAFLWATHVGGTDDEVSRALQTYAKQNAGYGGIIIPIDSALHPGSSELCDSYCRTLRQFSEIQNATARRDLRLVDSLAPAPGPKPNIFIIIIDSLRPDYLGAYDPAVDFTPNFDAFARDSIVMRRAYSQYAGTSLSVPTIWAGAMVLQAHYQQPFARLDSLKDLADANSYRMVVSYDVSLREALTGVDGPNVVRLDGDERRNTLELSDTLRRLESYYDRLPQQERRPLLFYTQPLNIHQVGYMEHLPLRTAANWRTRPGFNNRVAFRLHQADEAFGNFVRWLRERGLYDNSIILVGSDHGEALGEDGRVGHSSIIAPEVMRVPMLLHLPNSMHDKFVADPQRLVTDTDITPTLYYLLGYRHLRSSRWTGIPMIAETREELAATAHGDLLLASDSRAAFGVLKADGRSMFVAYDQPRKDQVFDLTQASPESVSSVAPSSYPSELVSLLREQAAFFGYRPSGGADHDAPEPEYFVVRHPWEQQQAQGKLPSGKTLRDQFGKYDPNVKVVE